MFSDLGWQLVCDLFVGVYLAHVLVWVRSHIGSYPLCYVVGATTWCLHLPCVYSILAICWAVYVIVVVCRIRWAVCQLHKQAIEMVLSDVHNSDDAATELDSDSDSVALHHEVEDALMSEADIKEAKPKAKAVRAPVKKLSKDKTKVVKPGDRVQPFRAAKWSDTEVKSGFVLQKPRKTAEPFIIKPLNFEFKDKKPTDSETDYSSSDEEDDAEEEEVVEEQVVKEKKKKATTKKSTKGSKKSTTKKSTKGSKKKKKKKKTKSKSAKGSKSTTTRTKKARVSKKQKEEEEDEEEEEEKTGEEDVEVESGSVSMDPPAPAVIPDKKVTRPDRKRPRDDDRTEAKPKEKAKEEEEEDNEDGDDSSAADNSGSEDVTKSAKSASAMEQEEDQEVDSPSDKPVDTDVDKQQGGELSDRLNFDEPEFEDEDEPSAKKPRIVA
jgi:hypothetical protein